MSILNRKFEKVSPFRIQNPGEYNLVVADYWTKESESGDDQELLTVQLKEYGSELTHNEMMATTAYYRDYSFPWKGEYTPTKAQLKELGYTLAKFNKLDDDSKKELIFDYPEDSKHLAHVFTNQRVVHNTNTIGIMHRKISEFLGAFVGGDHPNKGLEAMLNLAKAQKRVVLCELKKSQNDIIEIKRFIEVQE